LKDKVKHSTTNRTGLQLGSDNTGCSVLDMRNVPSA